MTKEQRDWCNSALHFGGSFVKAFAETMFYADEQNEKLMTPVLIQLMEKYPYYSDERMKVRMNHHTPGPWTVTPMGVDSVRIKEWPSQTTEAELQENVRLVAAAPDLLQACRVALVSLESWSKKGFHWGDEDIVEAAWQSYRASPEIVALEAAIAKAEGK